jgi:uncharacterized membrane protein YsdA (DUF1294 family)
MFKAAIIVCVYMLILSIILFAMMGVDKRRARKGGRNRIPEAALFRMAGLGGAVGGWIAMYVFRHKTKHTSFKVFFPALALVDLAILLVLCLKNSIQM